MSRSIWKGPYCSVKDLVKFSKIIKSRNSTILPKFIGNTVSIINGKDNLSIKIKKEMIGKKFGEFHKTRKWTKKSK